MSGGRLSGCVLVAALAFGLVLLVHSGTFAAPAAAQESAGLALAKESRALAAQGEVEAALDKAQQACALARAEFGDQHSYIGFILDDLATLSYRLGRLEDAAVLLNNQATILTALGRFAEAAPLYECAHGMFLAELGPANQRTAGTTRNLGIAYTELADYEQARGWFVEAAQAMQAMHGEESVELARALLDRAGADLRLEAVGEAQQGAGQALAN